MQKVLLVGVAGASALQMGVSPMTSSRAAVRMPAIVMQEQSVEVEATAPMDMDATNVAPAERFKAISLNALDEWADRFPCVSRGANIGPSPSLERTFGPSHFPDRY